MQKIGKAILINFLVFSYQSYGFEKANGAELLTAAKLSYKLPGVFKTKPIFDGLQSRTSHSVAVIASEIHGKKFQNPQNNLKRLHERSINIYKKNAKPGIHQKSPKIPFLTHHIWITSQSSPREVPDSKVEDFLKGLEKFNEDPWTHYVWVMDKKKLPQTIAKMEKSNLNIVFKEQKDIEELLSPYKNLTAYFWKYYNENRFVQALDTFKALLVYQYGGLVTDFGRYNFSPWLICRLYNYAFEIEGDGRWFDVPIMGSYPGNPFFRKLVDFLNSIENLPKEHRKKLQSARVFISSGITGFILAFPNELETPVFLSKHSLFQVKSMSSYKGGKQKFGQKQLGDGFFLHHSPELIAENFLEKFSCLPYKFNARHYKAQIKTSMNPLEHFCRVGWKEGNNPTPWFDMKYALQKENEPFDNPFTKFLQSKGQLTSLLNFETHYKTQEEMMYQKFAPLKVSPLLKPEIFLNRELILGDFKSKKPIAKIKFLENGKITPNRKNESKFEIKNNQLQLLSKSSFVMSVFDRVFETNDGTKILSGFFIPKLNEKKFLYLLTRYSD